MLKMPKIKFALLWVMATLPTFGQHSDVVVRTAEVIQISNGEESPNLSRVDSVSIYYINCYNVVYCGPPSAPSGGTYTFTSGSTPLWAATQLLTPAVFTPESVASPPSSIEASSIYSGSLTSPLGRLSSSVPALAIGTDVGQVLSSLTQQRPLSTDNQFALSANGIVFSTATQPSLVTSAYLGSQTLALELDGPVSVPLPLNEPSWITKGWTLDSASSLATVIGGSLPSQMSDGSGGIDAGRLLLTASSSMAPILSSVPTTLLGTIPLTGTAFPTGLAAGASGSLIGGLSASSGTNSESLSQQLESMKESGTRIVSWSLLYDTSPVRNN